MLNKEKLIEWAWTNLEFTNCPENWEDSYITDIIAGYQGSCHTNEGKVITYSKIRLMFEESEEEEE